MIGRTNTGGGGVGGVLTVTAPAGVTVSVSKDGKVKTKTANAEGLAVFKGLKTGTWQLTITDGSQVSTKPVVITADYSTVIAFFMATISITYPAGSTCTCSDGVTTLTAPNTSGTWKCVVPNTGSWTVSCTNGTESTEEVVVITTDGQSVSVEWAFWHGELYDSGNEYESITGGFIAIAMPYNSTAINVKAPTIVRDGKMLSSTVTANDIAGAIVTANKIDLSGYTKLRYTGELKSTSVNPCAMCVWTELGTIKTDNLVASMPTANLGSVVDGELNISSLPSGQYYIGFHITYNASYVKITKLWLE
jgi:hypothetical protein